MKNFTKLLVVALAVSLIAGMFAFSASAAATQPGTNANDLKPGSDKVIFIQDAPRDPETNMCKWDELPGNGSGTSPENPLRPLEHEDYDATAEAPMYDVTTAFYQATEMLAETGGTIVITGPVHFGRKESYGKSATQADTRTAKFENNVIKFTSVYNNVDYRETNGAKISLEMPAQLSINGSSIWENINIETLSMDRSMNFHFYATKIGEGVKSYPADELFLEVPNYYVSLAAGHRYAKSTGENPTLLVQSGTYNKVLAQWGGAVVDAKEITSNITIEGTTVVKGILCGTVHQMINYSGHVNITINGGTFEGDINGVGPTGFANADGVVTFKINGGNFGNAYGINAADITNKGNAPAATIVDFSGWKGEDAQLAYAVALVADEASGIDAKFVKLPAGKTVDELVEWAANNPYEAPVTLPPAEEDTTEAPTVDDTTEAPTVDDTTEAPTVDDTTKAPEADDTTKAPEADDTTKAPEADDTTKAPEQTTAPATDDAGEEAGFPWIIVVIAAVAVVAVVVVVVVVAKKKKA